MFWRVRLHMHTLHKTNNGKQQAEKEKQQKKAKMPVINNGKPRKNIVKWSYDLRSYESNFCNCVGKPEKFRTSTGFEPVTSQFRCDALTNWAMKPLTLGAGHLWVLMVPWGMNQWWNGIWNESYMNCGYEIKWSYDLRSYESNFCNCVGSSNPVEVLNFSGFPTQLQKLLS